MKIIFKYRDYRLFLRIAICKYKDLVVVWVLSINPVLTENAHRRILKYCLYEEPGQQKQDSLSVSLSKITA